MFSVMSLYACLYLSSLHIHLHMASLGVWDVRVKEEVGVEQFPYAVLRDPRDPQRGCRARREGQGGGKGL